MNRYIASFLHKLLITEMLYSCFINDLKANLTTRLCFLLDVLYLDLYITLLFHLIALLKLCLLSQFYLIIFVTILLTTAGIFLCDCNDHKIEVFIKKSCNGYIKEVIKLQLLLLRL